MCLVLNSGLSLGLADQPSDRQDDIPHKEVMKREREYTGVWINTNMQPGAQGFCPSSPLPCQAASSFAMIQPKNQQAKHFCFEKKTNTWFTESKGQPSLRSHESFKDSTCQVAQEVIQIAWGAPGDGSNAATGDTC